LFALTPGPLCLAPLGRSCDQRGAPLANYRVVVMSDERDPLGGRRGTVFAVMTVALIVLTIVMVTVIIPWVDSVARPS
jgi:hypothetical protein